MYKIFEKLSSMKIIPVIVINDASKSVALANALNEGGLPCAEVTFRTAAAADAIREMTKACPEMLVGAGTILTPEQAIAAIDAGAKFTVAPGLNPLTVSYCVAKGVPMLPGVCTPSEVEQGLSLGLDVLKFFPAEAAGGVNMLKALSGPYKDLKFLPTGGINQKNLREYLALKNVIACGGSWFVSEKLIEENNFSEITKLTREAVSLANS